MMDIFLPLYEVEGTFCVLSPYFFGVDFFVMHNCTELITWEYIQNGHKPKRSQPERPQTKKATKWYQNGHIQLATKKSFGHQIFICT